jgi:hypothetical protein
LAAGLPLLPRSAHGQDTTLGWSDEDRAAVAHVLALADGADTITLDLSDPKVAHFLKRHHEIAGMTPARYPGLHALMEEQQAVHATEGVARARTVQVSNDLVYSDLATLVLALYPTAAASTYNAAAVATMEASTDDPNRSLQIAYAGLCFYDSNNNPIGSCTTESSFGSGQYFPVNNSVTTADQAFSAAFSATYYDVTDKRYVAQFSKRQLDSIDYPQTQTISDPVILHTQNNSLKAALVCTSRTVNANANPGVCDYGTYQNTDVLVTMEGSVTYQQNQTPKTDQNGNLVGTGSVFLINTTEGGGCSLSPSIGGTNFFSQPQVTYVATTKTLNWNFNNLDFGPAATLICGGDGTSIQYALTLQVEDANNAMNNYLASQTSVAGTIVPHFLGPNSGALATPMLRLVAGCLHPDTMIAMAEGEGAQAIAEIKGEGELVISMGGVETHVVGTVDGEEATLFVVEADGGLVIEASAMHPFVMADGSWRAAADLEPGDRVLSADGPAEVTAVTERPYEGPVHNLILARTAEALHPETGSFYANGFLVGGHDAQQMLAAAKKADPKNVEALLPEGFEVDYASHLEDHGIH